MAGWLLASAIHGHKASPVFALGGQTATLAVTLCSGAICSAPTMKVSPYGLRLQMSCRSSCSQLRLLQLDRQAAAWECPKKTSLNGHGECEEGPGWVSAAA